MRTGISFTLPASDRQRLRAIIANPMSSQKHVWRARIVILSGDGLGTSAIMAETDKSRPPGKVPVPPEHVAEIVRLTQEPPPHEASRCRSRRPVISC